MKNTIEQAANLMSDKGYETGDLKDIPNRYRVKCIECPEPAQWVRSTQFAGEHPYCERHAKEEPDFDDEPDSYSFWYKIEENK